MLDIVPGWLRLKPSGFVHLILQANPEAYQTACGRRIAKNRLTHDYPPAAQKCLKCWDAA